MLSARNSTLRRAPSNDRMKASGPEPKHRDQGQRIVDRSTADYQTGLCELLSTDAR